ncbi:basic proline-rich protein-like [Planococcus citri]|uniref:basic proline-rich protein-like n=1 Tax=Planococcus citri TaxID=170843 RepID=UPI0031F89928
MVPDCSQYVKGKACAEQAGMDWKLLNGCQPTKKAAKWCDARYQQLNKLHEPKIPGVLYNMHYDAAAEAESLSCLKTGICNQIKKQGGQCPACGNSGGGGGSPGGGNPPSGNPPSGNPSGGGHQPGGGNPPSGNPPSGNPPSGNPPNGNPSGGGHQPGGGNPPSGNPPSGNPPNGNPSGGGHQPGGGNPPGGC